MCDCTAKTKCKSRIVWRGKKVKSFSTVFRLILDIDISSPKNKISNTVRGRREFRNSATEEKISGSAFFNPVLSKSLPGAIVSLRFPLLLLGRFIHCQAF